MENILLAAILVITNCKYVICINGGFCDPETAQCECPKGFRGPKCENGSIWEKSINFDLNY